MLYLGFHFKRSRILSLLHGVEDRLTALSFSKSNKQRITNNINVSGGIIALVICLYKKHRITKKTIL